MFAFAKSKLKVVVSLFCIVSAIMVYAFPDKIILIRMAIVYIIIYTTIASHEVDTIIMQWIPESRIQLEIKVTIKFW